MVIPYLRIIRPLNCLITALSVFVGAFLTDSFQFSRTLLMACGSAFFISAAGNVMNDVFDLAIDRINKPSRPLPAGQVSKYQAVLWTCLLFLAGILLAFTGSIALFNIALLTTLGLILYSWILKKTPLLGNLLVSFLSSLTFIYGAVAVNGFRWIFYPALFAFFFHLAREISKTIEDMAGDQLGQARTLPLYLGKSFAKVLLTLIFVSLLFLTYLPYYWGEYNLKYLLVTLLGVDSGIIAFLVLLWINDSPSFLRRLNNLLKLNMLAGLLALVMNKF